MNHLDNMTSRDAYQMRKYYSSARQVLIHFAKQKSLCFHSAQCHHLKMSLIVISQPYPPLFSPRSGYLGIPNSSQMSKQLTTADAFHDLGAIRWVLGGVLGRTWGFAKGSKDKGQHKTTPPMRMSPKPNFLSKPSGNGELGGKCIRNVYTYIYIYMCNNIYMLYST